MTKRFGILWQLLPVKVVAEVVLTTLLIVTGILGLVLSFVNPIQWITVRVPSYYHPSLASIDSLILSLNTNLIPVLATSSVIILWTCSVMLNIYALLSSLRIPAVLYSDTVSSS